VLAGENALGRGLREKARHLAPNEAARAVIEAIPDHESAVRRMVANAHGGGYEAIESLDEATTTLRRRTEDVRTDLSPPRPTTRSTSAPRRGLLSLHPGRVRPKAWRSPSTEWRACVRDDADDLCLGSEHRLQLGGLQVQEL
jgi:hypothetical protein